jgi:hypothetical protein
MSEGGCVSVECCRKFGITVVVSSSRCRGGIVQVEYSNRIKILSTVRATRSVSERLNERGACVHQTKGLDAFR